MPTLAASSNCQAQKYGRFRPTGRQAAAQDDVADLAVSARKGLALADVSAALQAAAPGAAVSSDCSAFLKDCAVASAGNRVELALHLGQCMHTGDALAVAVFEELQAFDTDYHQRLCAFACSQRGQSAFLYLLRTAAASDLPALQQLAMRILAVRLRSDWCATTYASLLHQRT